MKDRSLFWGVFLILLGIVGAWLEAYKHIHTAVLGVFLAAFGGRLIGEAYSKRKK